MKGQISDVSSEHEKMAEVSRNLQNQDKLSQDWITFVSQIWVRVIILKYSKSHNRIT